MSSIRKAMEQAKEYEKILEEAERHKPEKIEITVYENKMPCAVIAFNPGDKFIRIKANGREISFWPKGFVALYKAMGDIVVDLEDF